MTRRIVSVAAVAALVILAFAPGANAAPLDGRRLEFLPVPAGSVGSGQAMAVNAAGWAVGHVGLRPVAWSRGGELFELKQFGGQVGGRAHDINDNGSIVGYVQVGTTTSAVVWQSVTSMPQLLAPEQSGTTALAINNQGAVVGGATVDDQLVPAVFVNWRAVPISPASRGLFVAIGNDSPATAIGEKWPAGPFYSRAVAGPKPPPDLPGGGAHKHIVEVSGDGSTIAGTRDGGGAMVWHLGRVPRPGGGWSPVWAPSMLGNVRSSADETTVKGMSANGARIVGAFDTGDGFTSRGFIREGGAFKELLGLDSTAVAVNDEGLVVGEARVPGGTTLPVRWKPLA